MLRVKASSPAARLTEYGVARHVCFLCVASSTASTNLAAPNRDSICETAVEGKGACMASDAKTNVLERANDPAETAFVDLALVDRLRNGGALGPEDWDNPAAVEVSYFEGTGCRDDTPMDTS